MSAIEKELKSFQAVWRGGYFEGDPVDPMGASLYGHAGYVSILHALYLGWIKPYINSETTVLEIGPGRGAWLKSMADLGAKRLYALDALSAEHNGFWEYVGRDPRISYEQVKDCSLSSVPDNSIDYFFSFGCLCHTSNDTIREYFKSLANKMKSGSTGIVMVADYDKNNRFVDNRDMFLSSRALNGKRLLPFRLMLKGVTGYLYNHRDTHKDKAEDTSPRSGRWYHCGADTACEYLEAAGFKIVSRDIGIVPRDPVIHFTKP